MAQGHIPFPSIVAELRQLCREQRSGLLLITTDKHRLAQFNLDKGEIVFVSFQGKRGEHVLPLLRQIQGGQFRFKEKTVSTFSDPLPPTEAILSYLGGGNGDVETVGAATSAKPPNEGLPENIKAILERALAEFIGPIAAIVCAEHLQTAKDLESAIAVLADHVPNPEHASRFKNEVRAKI